MGDMADYYREIELERHLNPPEYIEVDNDFTQWTTANGKIIPLSAMTDTHLMNTINMLKRNKPDSLWIEPLLIELESR